ncbi:MAG: helix-turn-helix domain-containing protein, partial [Methyloceanibacter sp.]
MPSGYDAEVAELFRDLRAATALSEMDLAARIGTRPEVVQALEQGALQALPPWAETCRVVNAYGSMLNLDVRPLLRRIYAQLEAGIVELQPKPFPEVPTLTPPDSDEFGFGSGAQSGALSSNPLDIPWPPPPQPQAPAQRPSWTNAGP